MYRPVVTICTTSLTFNNSTFCPHSVFMCFMWISEQTAIISQHNINWLVFIREMESVYCAVRTELLKTMQFNFCLWQESDMSLRRTWHKTALLTEWLNGWMTDGHSWRHCDCSLKEMLQSIHCRFPFHTATWVLPYHCTQYLCLIRSHSMN